jgi:hypothetical protein
MFATSKKGSLLPIDKLFKCCGDVLKSSRSALKLTVNSKTHNMIEANGHCLVYDKHPKLS